ncbi:hypothetical protein ACHAPE_010476 [Trichoderma viride]
MARALEITSSVASGLQLGKCSFKGLSKTARFPKHLREVPYKSSKLLEEMETSVSHFADLCSGLLKQDYELYKHIKSPGRLNRIILCEAIDEMNDFLSPIAESGTDSKAKGRLISRLWKPVVSLRVERLGRLHTNLLRELSVVGIELQLTKDKATIVGGNISTRRLASLEAQLAALSADVKDLRLTLTDPQPLSTPTSPNSLEKSPYTNSIEAMLLESEASSDTSSDASPS